MLSGEVEADETFIGQKSRTMHRDVRARKITGTGGKDKAKVMGTLETRQGWQAQHRSHHRDSEPEEEGASGGTPKACRGWLRALQRRASIL
jgi:hypothetical protein